METLHGRIKAATPSRDISQQLCGHKKLSNLGDVSSGIGRLESRISVCTKKSYFNVFVDRSLIFNMAPASKAKKSNQTKAATKTAAKTKLNIKIR